MLWADKIANEIKDTRKPQDGKKFLIRDENTISGRIHVGSMRGVAVHGLVAEVFAEQGIANEYLFEIGDFDPFDSIPNYLDAKKYREHLGKPLYAVPSPESGFANFSEYFGAEFIEANKKAGFAPKYYRSTELYLSGRMDSFIKIALQRASDIRKILKEVSGSKKEKSWLPISVVCEQCGKMMTTHAYDFNGETIAYSCDKNQDEIKSCGYVGRIAPWKGAAKLFWKVDWAAKWAAQGVDVEGGGKDHSTKGGSRDVANHIAREIFNYEPPFDIPYEFFLVGGKKMSSSKGLGSSAKDIGALFPPEIFRLALIGHDIREQIDFNPQGESVPRLYDWYDELAENVRGGKADDFSRLYALCELPENRPPAHTGRAGAAFSAPWQMRFREVAFIVQMPHLKLLAEAKNAKGSELTEEEIQKLKERAQYAKFWLAKYAPKEFKYELQKEMPDVELSVIQKKALASLADYLEKGKYSGEEIHERLHEMKTEIPISPKELFQAIYKIFLNRDSGPKAGWFLAGLPRDFVIKRLKEAIP